MIKKYALSLLLLSCLALQGCISFNSLADARNAKGTGMSKVFSAKKEKVWQQALSVIEASDLTIVSEDEAKGLILAQQPISPLSLTAGQNVAVYVTDANGQTRVEVISKKSVGEIEFVSTDWDEYILEKLGIRLY